MPAARRKLLRVAEIGIRTVLGASRRSLVWLVLRRGLFYVTLGLAAGLPLTYFFQRRFGSPTSVHTLTEPQNLVPVIVVVVLVAMAACALPAAKAASVEPIRALRTE